MGKIEQNLLHIEKIKNIELYEITNLEILDSKIAMELVKNKYKTLQNDNDSFKINEYQLEIDNKYKKIESNYKKQIRYFTKLQKENVIDELFAMKIEGKNTTIYTTARLNNEQNSTYHNDIKELNEILEKDINEKNAIKQQLFILTNDIKTKKNIENKLIFDIEELNASTPDKKNDNYKTNLGKLKNNKEINNLQIFNYTKEFNEYTIKIKNINEKIKNNRNLIQDINKRYYKSNKLYKTQINNNKNEYELLLVQENFNLRKRNLLLIEVTKVIKDIHSDKETIIFIMNKKIELIKKNNYNGKNKYDILFKDKKILEEEKINNNKKLKDILEQSCLLINKVDNNINIECTIDNIESINLKINELLNSDLIKDEVLKNKLISIKTNNTLFNEKSVYISLLLFKYELDIITHIIKNLSKEINLNDLEIDLNNAKIDKLDFTILYKNVYKKTLENETNRKEKVIKQYHDKKLEYKKKYQNIEDTVQNYTTIIKLENEIDILDKNIEFNTKKKKFFDNNIENTTIDIKKLTKHYLKVKDELNYETKKLVDKKFQKIELLTKKFSEYYTFIHKFVELKNKYTNLELSKYIFIPIILSEDNKKQIYNIFNDNDREFKKYISNDSRYENLKKMVENITNIIVIDKYKTIKMAKIVIKFDINYDVKFQNNNYNIDKFKNDILNTLSYTLDIDKKFIYIVSITNNQNILLNVNIETNDKYTSQQEIVDFLRKQLSKENSELKKYGILEIISNIKEIENSILSTAQICDGNIITPHAISENTNGDYFDAFFNYCTNIEEQKGALLLYLPLITRTKALDTTLLDYSIYQRTVYEALCTDASINNIYHNYIELDKTLLKIDNINLIDRQEYSISFIVKLNEVSSNKQHILLSNGQIYQTFNLTLNNDDNNKIDWESYHNGIKDTFYNNNILTVGFMNNNLCINFPCSNDIDFKIITNNTGLLSQPNQWVHWIITKKNKKIKIYENLEKVFEDDIPENIIKKDTCNTNSSRYDKKTLYIGGIKTDLDSNTKVLNDLICYKGGLKDLRIYEIELLQHDISKIFINNCEISEQNKTITDKTLTLYPKLSDSSFYPHPESTQSTQVHKYTSTQVHKYTSTQVHKYTIYNITSSRCTHVLQRL